VRGHLLGWGLHPPRAARRLLRRGGQGRCGHASAQPVLCSVVGPSVEEWETCAA